MSTFTYRPLLQVRRNGFTCAAGLEPLPRLPKFAPLIRILRVILRYRALSQMKRDWENQILVLWRNARFREERYAALSLARARSAREFQTLPAMKIYEEMIVTGAWWDYVDDIASHHVGFILNKYPVQMRRKMLAWSKCPNLWKRRTAIICQLGRKHETDLSLLYSCIEPSLGSREFFLQKAIGWALRQYAWTDPQEVRRVKEKSGLLSALSRKEALRNIGADK